MGTFHWKYLSFEWTYRPLLNTNIYFTIGLPLNKNTIELGVVGQPSLQAHRRWGLCTQLGWVTEHFCIKWSFSLPKKWALLSKMFRHCIVRWARENTRDIFKWLPPSGAAEVLQRCCRPSQHSPALGCRMPTGAMPHPATENINSSS